MTHDLIVIGAGPAGMSAGLVGASLGLKTVVLDEQAGPGGQIYRNVTATDAKVAELLGPDYTHGRTIAAKLNRSGVERRHGVVVWDVSAELIVTGLQDDQAFQLRAPQIIAATGAMERASPMPGWTMPGVINAGAAQVALKTTGSIPSGSIVLAGGGPLLLLVACQLLDAGAKIAGVVETSPGANRWAALAHLPGAIGAPGYLAKGLRMLWRLRAAKVPWFTQATGLEVQGTERVDALRFSAGGREHVLDADVVLLHHGVIPSTQLSRLLRLQHTWNEAQLAWQPVCDSWGLTSLPGMRIAGDGAAIAGALAAEASGAIAALGAAHALGRLSAPERDQRAGALRRELRGQGRIRPFLDALYRPPQWVNCPTGETIVCRCEEVTAGKVREMAKLGCQGPNQTKFFSRCGMGPCQGRVCGSVVTQILAEELGKSPDDIGAYRIRSPLKPIPIGALASMNSLEQRGSAEKPGQ